MDEPTITFPDLRNDIILRAARGLPVPYTPVWIMRQAGRYLPEFRELRKEHDFFEICQSPQLACEVTLQPIKRFDLDAAIIFSDILVIPQVLGMDVRMEPGIGPVFPEPLKNASDLHRLDCSINVESSLKYVYEAITLTRRKLDGKVPLIGFSGAPWTLMSYMVEGSGSKTFSKSRKWLYSDPASSRNLLDLLTQVVTDHLMHQALSGAQLLQIFESHAGFLTSHLFDAFALPCLRRICDSLRSSLGSNCPPLIVFAKDGHHTIEGLSCAGFDVISLDWTMDPIETRRILPPSIVLQGNLDPCALYASDADLEASTRRMLLAFYGGPHIANLGHGIYPDTDPSRVRRFVELVHTLSAH